MKYDQAVASSKSGQEASSFDIQSVSRVGQILTLFGPDTAELTAVEVAERIGLNRTTAYRYCTSLVAAGILERGSERGTFALGPLMLRLGVQAIGRRRVVEVAPPFLARLSAEARATAVLALWGGTAPIVTLVHEDTSRTVVLTVRAGAQLDAATSQMRVFLAYLPDSHLIDRVGAHLGDAERAELEAGVYLTRRAGYSSVTLPDGLFAAAAPVFDEHGICATVALLSADPFRSPSESRSLATLLEVADAITTALGAGREGRGVADVR